MRINKVKGSALIPKTRARTLPEAMQIAQKTRHSEAMKLHTKYYLLAKERGFSPKSTGDALAYLGVSRKEAKIILVRLSQYSSTLKRASELAEETLKKDYDPIAKRKIKK